MLSDRDTFAYQGATFTVSIEHDQDHGAPWEEEDGHGDVSGWQHHAFGMGTKPPKAAGELILVWDHGSYRTYDFAGACKTALRDGWGVSPYRTVTENGANGLKRVTGHWFEGRNLQAFTSDWCDDINDAWRQVYAAHRATFPSKRAYAATAARADFERLQAWCNDQWSYVGVTVTLEDMEESASLWGIESDSAEYLQEVAHELADEILSQLESRAA